MKNATSILLMFVISLGMTGCGGGSQTGDFTPSGSTPNAASGNGRATFTIKWPDRSRLIPSAANSIKVDVRNGSTSVALKIVPRPANGGSTVVTLDSLPVGSLTVIATAYPQPDGTGTAQASGSAPLLIRNGQTTPFSLTMGSTIDHLELSAPRTSIQAGDTVTVTVTARDVSGAVVLISASAIRWASSDTAKVTVDASGNVRGVGPGAPDVTATDLESGKSARISFTVTAPQVITKNLDTWDLKYDAARNLVYGTTSISAPQYPHSVVPIDPGTGAFGAPISLDNSPRFLTLSGDGNHLYVGGDNGTVKRLALPNGAVEATINLPSGMTPVWMITLPNAPDSWIVALQSTAFGTTQAIVYDGTTPRPNTATMGHIVTVNDTGARLYGFERFQSSGSHYYTADIGPTGLTNTTSAITDIQGYGTRIQWAAGKMVADYSTIADPDTGHAIGQLTFTTVDHVVGVVPGTNRTYFASWDPKQIQVYDIPNSAPIASIMIGTISGGLETPTWCGANRVMVRSFSGSPNTITIVSGLP